MKKEFSVILALSLFVSVHSATLPESFYGIWEGKDRYVFFEQAQDDENPSIVILLKEYYGWYLDRAAEPKSNSEKYPRSRNAATVRKAEQLSIENIQAVSAGNAAYGSLDLSYSKSQKNTIHFLVMDEKLYLSYFVKDDKADSSQNWSFWRGIAPSKGFLVSPQNIPENITGYIIDGQKLYDVRYWLSDMELSSAYITFEYKDDSYQIPMHLSSGSCVYSCVSGRSKKVRNPVKAFEFKKDEYIFNDQNSVFTKNTEPYLVRLADRRTLEDLMQIVNEANSRVKPPAEPPFPPSNLDWHWDLIDQLESGNLIILEVRERQNAFGPRGKDFAR